MDRFFRFWRELRRRNVHRGVISYVVFSWVLLQVISVLGSLVTIPPWLGKAVLITLMIGFPFWFLFSWFYDITPEGIQLTDSLSRQENSKHRETISKRLNIFIISFLAIAVVLLFIDRFRLSSQYENTSSILANGKENSIAVLPFSDISLQQNQAYFADGLAEELINTLSKIVGIRVTSRTSAFSFRGKTVDIKTIAEKLNVNYVLEGSVRSQDSLIRVSVHLINAQNDTYDWSDTWDKPIANVFQIQDEISTNIADRLALRITEDKIPKVKQTDPEAYKLFLEGRYVMHSTYDIEGDIKAAELFKQSLAIDSTYAPTWVYLGWTYHFQTDHGKISKDRGYKLVSHAAQRAFKLDSTLAPAYELLGQIALFYDKDYHTAREYVQKGLKIAPNHKDILNLASLVALVYGETEKAIAYNERLITVNPLEEYPYYALGGNAFLGRQYDKAEKALKKALELSPDADITHLLLSSIYTKQGRFDEALEAAQQEKRKPLQLKALAIAYHNLNNKKLSDKYLTQLIKDYEKDYPYAVASIYAHRKEIDNAYKWLDKAEIYKDFALSDVHLDPFFDPIKEDIRWKPLLTRLGLNLSKINK